MNRNGSEYGDIYGQRGGGSTPVAQVNRHPVARLSVEISPRGQGREYLFLERCPSDNLFVSLRNVSDQEQYPFHQTNGADHDRRTT